ncbi:MAG: class II aldolase/adducin family protein [Pseudolabrys sp.]
MAVCHHHAPSMLPFCISGVELKPVFHLGATMGERVPFWDARDDFGDTTLIVAKPEEGASLARALGPHWTVLMRRHGATVAGRSLQELVFRCIYTARNAALQLQAHALGHVSPLNAEETRLAGAFNLQPDPVARAFEYWCARLDKTEGIAPRPRAAARAKLPTRKANGTAKRKARRQ